MEKNENKMKEEGRKSRRDEGREGERGRDREKAHRFYKLFGEAKKLWGVGKGHTTFPSRRYLSMMHKQFEKYKVVWKFGVIVIKERFKPIWQELEFCIRAWGRGSSLTIKYYKLIPDGL